MNTQLFDPDKIPTLTAGAMGAFLSILFQRDTSKLAMLTTIAAAEIVDYYFAKPIWQVMHSDWGWVSDQWQGPVAFTIGLLAIFVVGGVTRMAQDFWADPWNTIVNFFASMISSTINRVWKGKRKE